MAVSGIGGAIAAYRAAGAAPAAPGGEGGFGGLVARALEQAVEVGRSADTAAAQAMLGQGGVTEAVLAVSRAELALQTTVALRDRVVAAYQDVMRMPI
jgi:flagellar hook-basal body complex protein FliE